MSGFTILLCVGIGWHVNVKTANMEQTCRAELQLAGWPGTDISLSSAVMFSSHHGCRGPGHWPLQLEGKDLLAKCQSWLMDNKSRMWNIHFLQSVHWACWYSASKYHQARQGARYNFAQNSHVLKWNMLLDVEEKYICLFVILQTAHRGKLWTVLQNQ